MTDVEVIREPVQPILVRIAPDEGPVESQTATFGGWQTFKFVGTETVPIQILRQDTRRKRAVLQGLPGFVTNNILGNLWIGSKAQVGNGNPGAGGGSMIVSGMQVEVTSASEIWCLPDGTNELTLVVLDEIYRSTTE